MSKQENLIFTNQEKASGQIQMISNRKSPQVFPTTITDQEYGTMYYELKEAKDLFRAYPMD